MVRRVFLGHLIRVRILVPQLLEFLNLRTVISDMPDGLSDQQQLRDGGTRPVPDPTVLTTEALQREILALRQLLEQR
jgi:hypothetical protein